jgi:hypothetical protein
VQLSYNLCKMFDKKLTDKRVAESVMKTLGLEINIEETGTTETGERILEFTIFALDPLSATPFVFGKATESEIWAKVRELVEEYER